MATARTWTPVLKDCVEGRLGRFVTKVQNEYHVIYQAINDAAAESDLRQLLVYIQMLCKVVTQTVYFKCLHFLIMVLQSYSFV